MFELIIKDIMEVAGYLPIGILCGCIAVVTYLVYTVSPAGKKVSAGGRVKKSIVWFLLVVYLAVMAVTVFLSREPGSRQGIDMTLFQTWGVTPQEHAFVIENILLFVPFGVLFPLAVAGSKNGDGRAVDRLSKCTVLFGFLCSVCIETVQLITERGYCQLDDVVMNTLGSLAGYIIFLIIKKMKNIKKIQLSYSIKFQKELDIPLRVGMQTKS